MPLDITLSQTRDSVVALIAQSSQLQSDLKHVKAFRPTVFFWAVILHFMQTTRNRFTVKSERKFFFRWRQRQEYNCSVEISGALKADLRGFAPFYSVHYKCYSGVHVFEFDEKLCLPFCRDPHTEVAYVKHRAEDNTSKHFCTEKIVVKKRFLLNRVLQYTPDVVIGCRCVLKSLEQCLS